jgi:hypothetical protein
VNDRFSQPKSQIKSVASVRAAHGLIEERHVVDPHGRFSAHCARTRKPNTESKRFQRDHSPKAGLEM